MRDPSASEFPERIQWDHRSAAAWHGTCLSLLHRSIRGGGRVKYVISVVKPHKLEQVREALSSLGVQGIRVTEVKGHGRQLGHTEFYRGAEYQVPFVPKIKIEIAIDESLAEGVIEAIKTAGQTGQIGDGKI